MKAGGEWPKAMAPCTNAENLEEASGSWLQIGSAPAIVASKGVNQLMEDLSLYLSFSL